MREDRERGWDERVKRGNQSAGSVSRAKPERIPRQARTGGVYDELDEEVEVADDAVEAVDEELEDSLDDEPESELLEELPLFDGELVLEPPPLPAFA